jgi:ion channel-forming bestrophin family protein
MFCKEIIHVDLQNLKTSPCLNAYFPHTKKQRSKAPSQSLTNLIALDELTDEDEGRA